VRERQGAAALERVRHASVVEPDLDLPVLEADAEREALDLRRQARAETERVAVVAHPAEAVDRGQPRARERSHVHAVADVVLEVVDVHQRGLAEVVVRELEVADLGGHDRLRA